MTHAVYIAFGTTLGDNLATGHWLTVRISSRMCALMSLLTFSNGLTKLMQFFPI
jgi:hypothetical protein